MFSFVIKKHIWEMYPHVKRESVQRVDAYAPPVASVFASFEGGFFSFGKAIVLSLLRFGNKDLNRFEIKPTLFYVRTFTDIMGHSFPATGSRARRQAYEAACLMKGILHRIDFYESVYRNHPHAFQTDFKGVLAVSMMDDFLFITEKHTSPPSFPAYSQGFAFQTF